MFFFLCILFWNSQLQNMTTFNHVFTEKIFLKGIELKATTGDVDLTDVNQELLRLRMIINGLTGGTIPSNPPQLVHTRVPTNADDTSENWKVNDIWVFENVYICVINLEDNAVWKKVPDDILLQLKFADLDTITTQNIARFAQIEDLAAGLESIATQHVNKLTILDTITTINNTRFTNLDTITAQNNTKFTNLNTITTQNIGKFAQITDRTTALEAITTQNNTRFDLVNTNVNVVDSRVSTSAIAIALNKTNITKTGKTVWDVLDIYTDDMIVVKTSMGDSYIQDDGINPIISQSGDHFRGGQFSDKLFNQSFGLDTFAAHSSGTFSNTGLYLGDTTTKVYSYTTASTGTDIRSPWFQIAFRTPQNISKFYYKGEAYEFMMIFSNDGNTWYDTNFATNLSSVNGNIYSLPSPITATHWRFLQRFDGVPDNIFGWVQNQALYFYKTKVESTNQNLLNQVNQNTTNIQSLSNINNLNGTITNNTTRIDALQLKSTLVSNDLDVIYTRLQSVETKAAANITRIAALELKAQQHSGLLDQSLTFASTNFTKITDLKSRIEELEETSIKSYIRINNEIMELLGATLLSIVSPNFTDLGIPARNISALMLKMQELRNFV